MRRKYQSYSSDEWHQIMIDFASSGLTQQSFCRKRGLALSTFYRWRNQLGLTGSVKPPVQDNAFYPLMADDLSVRALFPTGDAPEAASAWQVELALGNGMMLRLRQA